MWTPPTLSPFIFLVFLSLAPWFKRSGAQTVPQQESLDSLDDDATWILTSAFVILTMQSGFGLLETGMVNRRNETNVMMKNISDVVLGGIAYWIFGFALSFGYPSNPIIGMGSFFVDPHLFNQYSTPSEIDRGLLYSRYIFQFSFAATATTIVSGCVTGRIKFTAYLIFSFFAIAIYAPVAHWIWADDGWLRTMGVHDFAGDSAVHLLGATQGFVGVLMLGPRVGRFEPGGASKYKMGNPVNVVFGLFMLWWGWMGFNCGSTFGISGPKWITACRIALTTTNASCAGGIVAFIHSVIRKRREKAKFDVEIAVNGILGGLVSITASCATVSAAESLAIGAIGAIVATKGNDLIQYCKLDDPVGAIGVHGFAAIWGMIAVGLFADSAKLPNEEGVLSGLVHGGGFLLLGLQLLATVVTIVWGGVLSFFFFAMINLVLPGGMRMSLEDELLGADYAEHGITHGDEAVVLRRELSSRRLLTSNDHCGDADSNHHSGSSCTTALPQATSHSRSPTARANDLLPDGSAPVKPIGHSSQSSRSFGSQAHLSCHSEDISHAV